MPGYYPIYLDIENRRILVIGGGRVARRKVEGFLRYGPKITVIGPDIDDALLDLADDGRIDVEQREYLPGDLEGASLVFVATDDAELNRQVAKEARERGILLNAVDQPAFCDFIVPSMVRRGDLCIAVSTGGACPRFSRRLRERLDEEYGSEYAAYVKLLGRFRDRITNSSLSMGEKTEMIDALLDSNILDLIREGNNAGADKRAEEILSERGL